MARGGKIRHLRSSTPVTSSSPHTPTAVEVFIGGLLGPILGPIYLDQVRTAGTGFSPLYAKGMWAAIEASVSMDAAVSLARQVMMSAQTWVRHYSSFEVFRADWTVARNLLPLQVRLLVEQVLWSEGGRYAELVTGFRPI